MVTRAIAAVLFILWLILVIMAKGGFVHLLLVSAVCVGVVDAIAVLRARMTMREEDKQIA